MIDFNLKVFLAVAKTNSFTKASEITNISQPAVTHQIKNLENMFKTRLFNRMGNKIFLTESGHILLKYASEIEQLYREAEQEILNTSDRVAGDIVFGATSLLGTYFLPKILGGFIKAYPDTNLSMLMGNSREIIQYLRNRVVELAIVSEPLKQKDLMCILFYHDYLTIIVYPTHPWCQECEIRLEDLFRENFVSREPGSGTREVYTEALEGACKGSQLRTVIALGNTEAIKMAVMGQMGFSIVSRLACQHEIDQGLLREVAVKDLHMTRDFFLVFVSERNMSVAAKKLKEYLIAKRRLDHTLEMS